MPYTKDTRLYILLVIAFIFSYTGAGFVTEASRPHYFSLAYFVSAFIALVFHMLLCAAEEGASKSDIAPKSSVQESADVVPKQEEKA
ncbi:MAG: hypothetical protein WC797_00065 [Candidatus Paceibacterota bacterium]|jgi:cytosine/uracil/thiamine/allantoin permease